MSVDATQLLGGDWKMAVCVEATRARKDDLEALAAAVNN